jgi:CheY-like chemotaxis protein
MSDPRAQFSIGEELTGMGSLRVLIVEDEGTVAFMLEDMLENLGHEVAASVARLEEAWRALEAVPFDFAILDVNLAGELSFDLARALVQRGTPFVFSTGYGAGGIPADLQGQSVLTKPFTSASLIQAVERLTG